MDLFLAGNRTKEKIMYMIECVAKKKSDKTLLKGYKDIICLIKIIRGGIMAGQICKSCKYRYEECYCSPNSTCKDYEKEVSEMKKWREEIIQNIKDCGQSLIDNAENIVGDYKYAKGFTITCYVDERDASPYISVDADFYPEKFVERHL